MDIQTLEKQYLALQLLNDKTTTEILYGGSMYSGKTYLACIYAIYMCMTYPGVRGAICRARLTNLLKSTLQTFFDLTSKFGVDSKFNYNSQNHIITFDNGSQIFLLDLFPLPQDPNYTRLGGHEYTFVIIDEAPEIPIKAYQVLKTRIRYKLKENGLIGKMLICSNPSKGWLYDIFYAPYKKGELPEYRKFIQSLPSDNIYADENVIKMHTIENLGLTFYNLLVLGDWDYNPDSLNLFDFNNLNQIFYNLFNNNSKQYITCDPAGQGSDSCVITYWRGYQCLEIYEYKKTTIPQIAEYIRKLVTERAVPIRNVIIDAGGLGLGVADLLPGCQKFIANARPLKDEKIYGSLKDQLYFKFAELVREQKIGITTSDEFRNNIIRELESHKQYNVDGGKTQVTPKAIVKQQLGKSPDFADAVVMRAYFEYYGVGEIIFGY